MTGCAKFDAVMVGMGQHGEDFFERDASDDLLEEGHFGPDVQETLAELEDGGAGRALVDPQVVLEGGGPETEDEEVVVIVEGGRVESAFEAAQSAQTGAPVLIDVYTQTEELGGSPALCWSCCITQ